MKIWILWALFGGLAEVVHAGGVAPQVYLDSQGCAERLRAAASGENLRLSEVRTAIEEAAFQTDKGLLDYLFDFRGTPFAARMQKLLCGQVPQEDTPFHVLAQHNPRVLRWLNLGAGKAVAEVDAFAQLKRFALTLDGLQVTSLGYQQIDPVGLSDSARWIHQHYGPDAFRYLETREFPRVSDPSVPLEEHGYFFAVPDAVIGLQDLITDQRGVLNFVTRYHQNLTKALGLLYPGGDLVMSHPADPGFFEILDPSGNRVEPMDYFRAIRGAELTTFYQWGLQSSFSGELFRIFAISLRRTEGPLWVPEVDLIELGDESPPRRVFRLRAPLP